MKTRTTTRRAFLMLLGSAAVAWPYAVRAQAPVRLYRIGLLSNMVPVADTSPQGAVLIRGLVQHGYTLGRNIAFERRAAEGHLDLLPRPA